ncbi:MAG: polymerase, sigma subunit, family [Nocardioidaceae bacterium]|nr:polymerase, sigma subunit, family [Nocardioidaceae bacterium]
MSDPFADHRDLLFTVAYEMLGSAADAEDVVQEAWLRWAEVDQATVENPRAYAVRIVTRLALNQMRTLSRRRETYVGPWLPEPLLTGPDVADDVLLAESVSLAMLVVLESLQPVERAVFVLREVFGFEHAEIADALDRTPAAVRQIAHRAREHVQARRPAATVSRDEQLAVTRRFAEAAATGDIASLVDVLAPDVVLLTDGGGVKKAALRPILGVDKVLRFLGGVGTEIPPVATVVMVNGSPCLALTVDGVLDTLVASRFADGKVVEIYAVRNPAKLDRLEQEARLTRAYADG